MMHLMMSAGESLRATAEPAADPVWTVLPASDGATLTRTTPDSTWQTVEMTAGPRPLGERAYNPNLLDDGPVEWLEGYATGGTAPGDTLTFHMPVVDTLGATSAVTIAVEVELDGVGTGTTGSFAGDEIGAVLGYVRPSSGVITLTGTIADALGTRAITVVATEPTVAPVDPPDAEEGTAVYESEDVAVLDLLGASPGDVVAAAIRDDDGSRGSLSSLTTTGVTFTAPTVASGSVYTMIDFVVENADGVQDEGVYVAVTYPSIYTAIVGQNPASAFSRDNWFELKENDATSPASTDDYLQNNEALQAGPGRAYGLFGGDAGSYTLTVHTLEDPDGPDDLRVYINDVLEWQRNVSGVTNDWRTDQFNHDLDPGDEITLWGRGGDLAYAKFARLDIAVPFSLVSGGWNASLDGQTEGGMPSTSLAIDIPAGVEVGELLIISGFTDKSSMSGFSASEPNWNIVEYTGLSSVTPAFAWKIAEAGDAGSTVTISAGSGAAQWWTLHLTRVQAEFVGTGTLDVAACSSEQVSTNSVASAQITPTTGRTFIHAFAINDSAFNVSAVSGWSNDFTLGTVINGAVLDGADPMRESGGPMIVTGHKVVESTDPVETTLSFTGVSADENAVVLAAFKLA